MREVETGAPDPGWYADPAAADHLRLWDGRRWTEESRPCEPIHGPVAEVEPTPRLWRQRRLIGIAAVVAVGLLAAAGWSHALGSRDGTGAAGNLSRAPAAPAVVDCTLASRRPGPQRVVDWLATHGVPTKMAENPTKAHAGTCGVATFTDTRTQGKTNLVLAFPTASAASAAPVPTPGFVVITAGIYQVALDPALRAEAAQYKATLAEYVALTNPPVPAPPRALSSAGR